MPTAFVLVNAEIGFEEQVIQEIRNLDSVKEAYAVYGLYDIIAKIERDNMAELRGVVTDQIRRLDKVRSTLTMICMSS
jgi:DNA-binding Lrp family transcriptional regulator